MWIAVVPIVRGSKEEVKELVIVVVIHQAVVVIHQAFVELQLGSQVHFSAILSIDSVGSSRERSWRLKGKRGESSSPGAAPRPSVELPRCSGRVVTLSAWATVDSHASALAFALATSGIW